MIRVLWDFQVDAIIDVNLGEADTDMYKYEPMIALLVRWENIKKDKHGKHCHNQRKHFSMLVISVGIILGVEALILPYQLSRVMADKRE